MILKYSQSIKYDLSRFIINDLPIGYNPIGYNPIGYTLYNSSIFYNFEQATSPCFIYFETWLLRNLFLVKIIENKIICNFNKDNQYYCKET